MGCWIIPGLILTVAGKISKFNNCNIKVSNRRLFSDLLLTCWVSMFGREALSFTLPLDRKKSSSQEVGGFGWSSCSQLSSFHDAFVVRGSVALWNRFHVHRGCPPLWVVSLTRFFQKQGESWKTVGGCRLMKLVFFKHSSPIIFQSSGVWTRKKWQKRQVFIHG